MYGDTWNNPLIKTFDAYNESITIDGSYLDLDGAILEGYTPIAFSLLNSHINVTNF